MSVVIITGSSGLVGSESVKCFHDQGFDVVGIDNNMRQYFFGSAGSTEWSTEALKKQFKRFVPHSIDIRDQEQVSKLFRSYGRNISVVIHAAAQPSHDWSAQEPLTDFSINATGTLVLLEAVRQFAPEAVFVFVSTNKVYGDSSNALPFVEKPMRWELREDHPYYAHGVDEGLTVDHSKHSVFGASKTAADIMVQEYGRYFGMKTGIFRCGCVTGPAHSGVELHGFLAYLVHCTLTGKPYTIYGYKGKQVRDNIHSHDLVNAFLHFYKNPRPAVVYNMGGSRRSNCSVLEAIQLTESLCQRKLNSTYVDNARSGDHIWWISDVRRFQEDFPGWNFTHDLKSILREIYEAHSKRHFSQGPI